MLNDLERFAREMHELREEVRGLSRARQVARSTLPVEVDDGDGGTVEVDVPVDAAIREGVAAGATAQTAQAQTAHLQESIAQPGINKFDTRPIVSQDITGWSVRNLTDYTWLSDGIRVRTPDVSDGVARGVNLQARERVPVRPGDVLTWSVALDFDTGTAYPASADAGFGWSFYNADGSLQEASTAAGSSSQGVASGQYTVPPGAVEMAVNLYAYVPQNAGYTSPTQRRWVTLRRPYVGVVVGERGLAEQSVTRGKVGLGAIGPAQLGSDVQLGVPDDSLTTEKYKNGSVTDAKLTSVAVSRLTGTLPDFARLPGVVTLQAFFTAQTTYTIESSYALQWGPFIAWGCRVRRNQALTHGGSPVVINAPYRNLIGTDTPVSAVTSGSGLANPTTAIVRGVSGSPAGGVTTLSPQSGHTVLEAAGVMVAPFL